MYFRILLFVLLLAGAGACSHRQYAPNAIEIPFNTEKGQASASMVFGHPDYAGFFDVHASYSPWRNITGFVSYQTAAGNVFTPLSNYSRKDFVNFDYIEGAFGGKLSLKNPQFGLGLYTGAGHGRMINGYGGEIVTNLQYNKYFAQPTLSFQGKIAHFGLGVRFSNLQYTTGKIDVAAPIDQLQEIANINEHSPFNMMEAGFQMGFYFKPITWMLSVQTGTVFHDFEPNQFGFEPKNILLGFKLNLNDLKRKKRDTAEPE